MKWRNQILALICLLAFAALGVLYFQNWVVQKPFGIILFVGEGLTAQRTAATRVYIGGADNPLAMDGLVRDCLAGRPGSIESGELAVIEQSAGRLLPTSMFTRWSRHEGAP